MATLYSAQMAVRIAKAKVRPDEHTGKERIAWFDLNTTTTPVTTADTIVLTTIPANARITGGWVTWGAMGASATLAIGITGTTAKYMAATDVSAIGSSVFARTQALSFGQVTTAEVTVIGTPAGANFAAAKDLMGYVAYVVGE
jgi:hypothetical protein